ncbi:chromosomal replication initiator protein DnaA [Rickettsia endosymbiont of Cardiosporidium cionae]|uniref:chromosomal replication initiator protein DnaA n=1 Tax=Rickettsia endosymbiont of Cardiosporidium cionae TaxID=2777155 RepID=UPI0018954D25|nr:chromosomal replication initiator protein DnaA [Rickettsia endosymbiont of Cardiosporidium cionae]KAF8818727.1 chromosomal replication initiator protein DnaA [Rickettsia endosymbiont of Cardiosporidium cionae]
MSSADKASLIENNKNYHINLWKTVQKDLTKSFGNRAYQNWFSKISFYEFSSYRSVILFVPTNFIKDWIKSHYLTEIHTLYNEYDISVKHVEIIVKNKLSNIPVNISSIEESEENIHDSSPQMELVKQVDKNTIQDNVIDKQNEISVIDDSISYLDHRFTFKNFVIGNPNELAYSASLAVAESKTAIAESNPLFLYGGVGLGKTHLMHAIAWHVHTNNKQRKVLYMSAEKFMYCFIKALRNKDIVSFKEEFRSVDVLMIDDIQFICGKNSTQEEFFHTFNAIIDNNRQIVISCDRSPSDLDNIEDRIKSRLGWGLVADVHSTTYELRLGILQSKIEQMCLHIPQNVVEFLADKITSNVRELEGALNKVIAYSTLVKKEINLDNTKLILKDLLRSNEKVITIQDIKSKVAQRFNIQASDIKSDITRSRKYSKPRQIAMYLSKHLTSKSLVDISRDFGKKDHTTVIHAIKKIENLIEVDCELRTIIDSLSTELQGV